MRLYIIRHADPDYENNTITADGHKEAKALSKRLAVHGLAHLLEIPVTLMWSGFWLAPSSVTTILFDERSPGIAVPRCIGLGDVSHLYESGLPVKQRGIIANFY